MVSWTHPNSQDVGFGSKRMDCLEGSAVVKGNLSQKPKLCLNFYPVSGWKCKISYWPVGSLVLLGLGMQPQDLSVLCIKNSSPVLIYLFASFILAQKMQEMLHFGCSRKLFGVPPEVWKTEMFGELSLEHTAKLYEAWFKLKFSFSYRMSPLTNA